MEPRLFTIGVLLIFLGLGIAIVSTLLLVFHAKFRRVKGGGVILIGPFPIVFGTDKESVKVLLVLALALVVVMFLFMMISIYVM